MQRSERLPNGSEVRFDISQGLAIGRGLIVDARYDDGWLYRLDDVTAVGPVDDQRNDQRELWVWDFEVVPLEATGAPRAE
ncbi:MAG TPA: hypothetical protein VGM05_20085 [Planctomycetaceae bacterium]|jgi:hypothetical protein